MVSLRWLLLPLALIACPTDEKDGDTGDTAGGQVEDSVDDSIQPSISSVDTVDCIENQSAGETWMVTLSTEDPQGAETVSGGTYTVLSTESGGELASYTLACNDGGCTGSFRADYDSITCSLEGSITFRFVVEDQDGNLSAPFDYDT